MGSKRPFDGQEPLQLPCKYSKQFASDENLTSFIDEKCAPVACLHPGIEINEKRNKPPLLVDHFEVKSVQEVNNVVDRALVGSLRFPSFMDSHGDGNVWCGDMQRSFLPDYNLDHVSPKREPVKVDNEISSFLDRYPRKQVPIGENHQAVVPEREFFKPSLIGASNSNQALITDEENLLMGTCVILMPDFSLPAQSILPAGVGRKDCDCKDKDSVRCVRQHVFEARDKLVKLIDEDSFRDLGFFDMGEEVSNKWNEEEEHIFHGIVFSNPASLGKDFWPSLLQEFPTRSVKDIVSYYFNVFMLRKRATQNRSRFLDIDSDDDEWHPGHGPSYDLHNAGEDDDNYSLDDDNTTFADDDEKGLSHSQLNIRFSHQDNDFFPVNQDGSFSSFEYQSSIDSLPTKAGVHAKELNTHASSHHTASDNGLNPGCVDDSSHFRHWEHGFSAGLDQLLPTHNMIEELFGPGSWYDKPNQH